MSRTLVITEYVKNADEYVKNNETLCYYGNGLIYETDNNGMKVYHYNNLGSTISLTDESGQIIEEYTYMEHMVNC